MIRHLILCLTVLMLGGTAASYASDVISTGRYARVVNTPEIHQRNPLKVTVQTRIPFDITTVGEAVAFLLHRSGYQLADDTVLSPQAKRLLAFTLPASQRNLGPLTLDQCLMLLGGEGYRLVVDPVNRKIAYVVVTDFLEGGRDV